MKKKLIIGVLFFIIIILLFILLNILYFYNFIPHRAYTDADFNITTYKSSVDKDNDGIDDQTDILNEAKEYIKTKPVYKSKYYETGWPNDKYGVCVDIVNIAMKNAGYDMMELVDADIRNNQEQYNIKKIDKKIDFRRVVNLQVYFKNNHINLTTDIYEIKEWQAGDIVIFNHHIGIISDKRNKKGIPFVIHHDRVSEHHGYEEDILERRKDIVGHYRVS